MENYNPYFEIVDGRPVVTDEERLKRDWDESNRNIKFLNSNYETLLSQYPDQWIALHHEKVIATASSHENLLLILDELGIRNSGELTEFMNTNPMPLIL